MMARAAPAYRKLPGTGSGLIGRYRLYLSAEQDHLMCIDHQGFTEHYARFDLNDIQALCARETSGWWIAGSLSAIVLALCIGGAITLNSLGGTILLGTLGAMAGIALLYNLIAGPSCKTMLYTAVSERELKSLHRLRTFRKVTARIAPLIEAKQGVLDASQLRAPAPVAELPPEKPTGTRATLWLSFALLADAGFAGLMFWLDETAIAVIRLLGILLITGLVVMGFATIPRRRANRSIRLPVWAGFMHVILAYSFIYVAFIIGSLETDSGMPAATALDALLPSFSGVSYGCNIVLLALSLVLGTWGLLAVASARANE